MKVVNRGGRWSAELAHASFLDLGQFSTHNLEKQMDRGGKVSWRMSIFRFIK